MRCDQTDGKRRKCGGVSIEEPVPRAAEWATRKREVVPRSSSDEWFIPYSLLASGKVKDSTAKPRLGRISTKNQVTLPVEVLERAHLGAGYWQGQQVWRSGLKAADSSCYGPETIDSVMVEP
jgi:hypothetical protein